MKQALPTSFLIAVLMPVFSSYSGPWEIAVHESWHSTVMSAYSWTPGGSSTLSTSRVEMASSPVQDALYHPASSVLEAVAGAGLSGLLVYTAADGLNDPWRASVIASAESRIEFSPAAGGSQTLTVSFAGWNQWYHSKGFISLWNMSANQEVWTYGWGMPGITNAVPWAPAEDGPAARALLNIETLFSAADTYELTLFSETVSNPADTERICIELQHIQIVPEPSATALLFAGMLLLARARRH